MPGTNLEPAVLRLRIEPFNNTPGNTREKEMLAKSRSATVRFSSASHKSIVAGGAYSRRARRAKLEKRKSSQAKTGRSLAYLCRRGSGADPAPSSDSPLVPNMAPVTSTPDCCAMISGRGGVVVGLFLKSRRGTPLLLRARPLYG
jgi:hypothetical protein